jgi:gamma-glutamyltranspeptidase/glutathione hydrolase
VPGTVAGWDVALRRFGSAVDARGACARRADRRARASSSTRPFFDQIEANAGKLGDFPASARIYLDRDGTPRDVGQRVVNRPARQDVPPPAARGGAGASTAGRSPGRSRGRCAGRRCARARARRAAGHDDHRGPARVRAILRRPTAIKFRDLDIYGMAPPSSGGSTIGEALNIIEALGPARRARPRCTASSRR